MALRPVLAVRATFCPRESCAHFLELASVLLSVTCCFFGGGGGGGGGNGEAAAAATAAREWSAAPLAVPVPAAAAVAVAAAAKLAGNSSWTAWGRLAREAKRVVVPVQMRGRRAMSSCRLAG